MTQRETDLAVRGFIVGVIVGLLMATAIVAMAGWTP